MENNGAGPKSNIFIGDVALDVNVLGAKHGDSKEKWIEVHELVQDRIPMAWTTIRQKGMSLVKVISFWSYMFLSIMPSKTLWVCFVSTITSLDCYVYLSNWITLSI